MSEVSRRHLKPGTEDITRTSTEFQDGPRRAAPENGGLARRAEAQRRGAGGAAEPHCGVGNLREELG